MPMVNTAEEIAVHVLLQCNFAKRVWEKGTTWNKIPIVNTTGNLKELLKELNEVQRNWKMRKVIHAIAVQTMWTLWKIRNNNVFKGKQGALQTTVDDIKENSFQVVKMKSKLNRTTQKGLMGFQCNIVMSFMLFSFELCLYIAS
ncbi:hypothetical protein HanPI659440_Chr15g0591241 [Helianthus annuus]|nr:hypothetical protein HanPI659440_Chr15g0591241 [Helianthus annuus]